VANLHIWGWHWTVKGKDHNPMNRNAYALAILYHANAHVSILVWMLGKLPDSISTPV